MEALLIVDVQNDFCPFGALPVPDGDKVVEPLNKMVEHAVKNGWLVVVSRDWHPKITNHFQPYGGLWPVHCVRETHGAAFHSSLRLPQDAIIVSKGVGKNEDGYSAFQPTAIFEFVHGRTQKFYGLRSLLKLNAVGILYIGGLATDYCVKATALDALKFGFEVTVLEDAIRGVEVNPGDTTRAVEEIKNAGAHFVRSDLIINSV